VVIVFSTIFSYTFFPKKYKDIVLSVCNNLEIDSNLVFAIIKAESSFDKNKVSKKGAVGLMQIMPQTAQYLSTTFFSGNSYDLYNPHDNILYGVTYLLYLTEKFKDEKTVLVAYNAGEGRTKSWLLEKKYSSNGQTLDVIPFKETRDYANRVTNYKKLYKLLYF
jgi:soluble lytic murein transglycosylase